MTLREWLLLVFVAGAICGAIVALALRLLGAADGDERRG